MGEVSWHTHGGVVGNDGSISNSNLSTTDVTSSIGGKERSASSCFGSLSTGYRLEVDGSIINSNGCSNKKGKDDGSTHLDMI